MLYVERAFNESIYSPIGIKVNGNRTNIIRYVDEFVILADNPNDLQTLLDEINETMGLEN